MKAIKIIGILLISFGFIIVLGETVDLSLIQTILVKASGLLSCYLGYKALVKADPSLVEED